MIKVYVNVKEEMLSEFFKALKTVADCEINGEITARYKGIHHKRKKMTIKGEYNKRCKKCGEIKPREEIKYNLCMDCRT